MFQLDPRLQQDCHFLFDAALCRWLLLDDARFPWLVLVPRRDGVQEIMQLTATERRVVMEEMTAAGEILQRLVRPEKINIGALGNIVKQLHIHVVARSPQDAAWPGPVWGAGQRVPYDDQALLEFSRKILQLRSLVQ